MSAERTDPLGRALTALRYEREVSMHRHLAGDDISGAAALRMHHVLEDLERLPAGQRAGGRDCWIYPGPPEAP